MWLQLNFDPFRMESTNSINTLWIGKYLQNTNSSVFKLFGRRPKSIDTWNLPSCLLTNLFIELACSTLPIWSSTTNVGGGRVAIDYKHDLMEWVVLSGLHIPSAYSVSGSDHPTIHPFYQTMPGLGRKQSKHTWVSPIFFGTKKLSRTLAFPIAYGKHIIGRHPLPDWNNFVDDG